MGKKEQEQDGAEGATKYAETPLMKQYNSFKAKYPDAILLFRIGDFYETFGEDAIKSSAVLGITLTRRANGAGRHIELAGFPHHSIDTYLPKLVKAGFRVAICDQLEDPKLTKTIVKRGVTELVTPGVSYNDKILESIEYNFLASIHLIDIYSGIALLDISTGEMYIAQGSLEYIDKLVQGFRPSEIIIQKNKRNDFLEIFGDKHFISTFEDWVFSYDFTYDLLVKHFGTNSLKGFGVENIAEGIIAAGAAFHYLAETQHNKTQHITKISRIEEDHYIWLDRFTIRNLELIYSPHENGATLLSILDNTCSPMGSRMLRKWIVLPLKDKVTIEERLQVVSFFKENQEISHEIRTHIKHCGDMERLISKVAIGKVNPRELVQLQRSLLAVDEIKKLCNASNQPSLLKIAEQLNPCHSIQSRIAREINEDAPVQIVKGGVIAQGVNEELDDLRNLAFSGKDYLLTIQQRESDRTHIPSLKIGFNNVFGYYLEVTNTHKDKVPEDWIRKQTLTNAERYITPELKEYEEKILGAEEKILALETNLYNELLISLLDYIEPIQLDASLLARVDVLLSFSMIAIENNYVRPVINESFDINIKNGRHPVIEKQLPITEKYIANDLSLDPEKQQIIMITGPNMSGKSALLRQTALIVLMAQIGSFVPADSAEIGIVDKIFTRVGASDNISSGESTFMVEMNETASIMNNVSARSLILLDEIGRGTSTYDGISIAWAIAEYLHQHKLYRPKVLFATHYHELNEMSSIFKRIRNFHVTVKQVANKVIFLRKLAAGGSEHSFGIHVARMAGMPRELLERAEKMLTQLEASHSKENLVSNIKSAQKDQGYQLSFIQLDDPLLQQIKEDILNTDVDRLTPVEALMKLNEIKGLLGKKK